MLTPEDTKFLNDRSNYAGGPTFDMEWHPKKPGDFSAIFEALLQDERINRSIPEGDGSREEDVKRVVTWFPLDLNPVGMSVTEIFGEPSSPYAWIYPPHTERCTGSRDFDPEYEINRKIIAFFGAAIELTNRLHAAMPLAQAGIGSEGEECVEYESSDDGVILLPRYILDAAGWPYVIPNLKDLDAAKHTASVPLGWQPIE